MKAFKVPNFFEPECAINFLTQSYKIFVPLDLNVLPHCSIILPKLGKRQNS